MTKEERQQKVRWLQRYQDAKRDIDSLEMELAVWQDRAMNMTRQPTYFKHYSRAELDRRPDITAEDRIKNEMPPVIVRGGHALTLEDCVCKADEVSRDINGRIEDAQDVLAEIEAAIQQLGDGRQRNVLRYKYVNGMYLEEICVKMKYSYQHVRRIHQLALERLKMSSNEP